MNATSTAGREIRTTRLFDAPRELVWQAWTDPKHVANWWGPNGFTNTVHEMDVRPGGIWRMTMHGPDGTDYPNRMDFIEVVPPSRLVYNHGDDGAGTQESFHVTITFDDQDGKTRITMVSLFSTREERDRIAREFGAEEGAEQHLNRLAEYLKTM
jgi:uncharacterized protein YndB with AHSA1/START domain